MTETRFDVLGIGNAIVDVLAHTEDSFLDDNGMPKGSMTLVDQQQADRLYDRMPPGIECSGGSAANTVVGVASLGGKAAFIGKVHDDDLGKIFRHDIKASGVEFRTPAASDGPPTARCMVLVTPDAQRTMGTFLGACATLGPEDMDAELIGASKVTYLEGYLWDPPQAKEAFRRAAQLAHDAGREVSLTLSDAFCVDRHRASFLELVEGHVDVLFANEAELLSLFETEHFDDALAGLGDRCRTAAVTRSEKGSVILQAGKRTDVPAHPIERLVDTTGAGDLYAAGFLFGYTRGLSMAECGRLGGLAAAEIISHVGARPERPLAEWVAEAQS